MIKCIRNAALCLLLGLCLPSVAAAAVSAAGEWRVHDGTADIRIVDCDGALWGTISRVDAPDTDKHNPDPSKRARPVLGMPILLAMRPAEAGRWEGDIYNAENGKTYSGSIRLKTRDILAVQGCVLGLLCGGEDWTRLPQPPGEEPAAAACLRMRR